MTIICDIVHVLGYLWKARSVLQRKELVAPWVRDALLRAEEEIGPQLSGYILDLRGNPGGLLDQAVTVSDLFLSNGRIVSTHGRHPDSHQYFDAAPETLAHQRPVVVLVNGNSASASEIVAAALQDTGRAVVIGTSSFGKGSVQTVLRLPNNGELTLTWARFHAPSGYSLHGRGVLPDICTSGQEETPDQVIARLQSGLLPLSRKVTQRIVDTNDRTELSALRSLCPARHSDAEVDVEVARRLLDSPGLFALARGFDDIETVSDSNVQTSAVGTTHRSAFIVQFDHGEIGAGCHHNGCTWGWRWACQAVRRRKK